MTPAMETYYVHTRTGMAQCGIRYATPIDPTPDESAWTEFDLQAFWEGLNGIEPISAMSKPKNSGEMDKTTIDQISCDTEQTEKRKSSDLETEVEHSDISASSSSDTLPESKCDHLWLTKAGTGYRFNFVEVCARCGGQQ